MRLNTNFRLYLLLLSFCFLINISYSTLSKSDRRKSQNNVQKKSFESNTKPITAEKDEDDEDDEEDDSSYTDLEERNDILKNYDQLDITTRSFEKETLAYVTPWNNHGYDVVKWAAQKFTMISPVWFQINIDDSVSNNVVCSIAGTHDIDRGWLNDIRKNNSEIKFVPRFLFDQMSKSSLEKFLTIERFQRLCVHKLIDFIKDNDFNGAVLEIWLQMMIQTKGTAAEYLIEFIELFGASMFEEGLISIIPLTPPLDEKLKPNHIVSPQILERMAKSVNYINLMTYDFAQNNPSPVAPIYWVLPNVEFLLKHGVASEQILLGLNYYGYHYSSTNGASNVVLGKDFIEFLKRKNVHFEFDTKAQEHRVLLGANELIYYPTKKSLQLRLEFASQVNLGGVAIWDVGQGLDYFTSVL